MTIKIHPMVDDGVKAGDPNFSGGTLKCKCASSTCYGAKDYRHLN